MLSLYSYFIFIYLRLFIHFLYVTSQRTFFWSLLFSQWNCPHCFRNFHLTFHSSVSYVNWLLRSSKMILKYANNFLFTYDLPGYLTQSTLEKYIHSTLLKPDRLPYLTIFIPFIVFKYSWFIFIVIIWYWKSSFTVYFRNAFSILTKIGIKKYITSWRR